MHRFIRFLPAVSFLFHSASAEDPGIPKYPAAPALEVREREIARKPTSPFIRIDQFGYLPNALSKVAVIVHPKVGPDAGAGQSFAPSTGENQYQLRLWSDDSVVFTGTLAPWKDGTTDTVSGDQAWWFDFSKFKEPGSYYVYDTIKKVGSYPFDIRGDVYADALRAAVRMYFYQRINFDKKAEFAGTNWADGPAFNGPRQDTQARSIRDRENPATAKDLSGGWFDAGDFNKYTTFTLSTLHPLLDAYAENPSAFGDNYRIPESGNGIPDLLDEVKFELDWLRRMQLPDGDALIKMGLSRGNDHLATPPPSSDPRPRFYYPESSSAATITLASIFAHAAVIYRDIPALRTYSEDLRDRAVRAFDHYQKNPKNDNIDTREISAGEADLTLEKQAKVAVQAAVWLYAATCKPEYRDYVETHHRLLDAEMKEWRSYETDLTGALLHFTTLAGVSPQVSETIRASKVRAAADPRFYGDTDADPYRAHMPLYSYHWGSLSPRAHIGSINLDLVRLGLDPSRHDEYRRRAEGTLHSFHGVNAFNKVFLTNMYAYGAENSVDEIFHMWFRDGSDWDNVRTSKKGGPPPGFLTGGPNKNWKPRAAAGASIPAALPAAKSYREWNGERDASWEVTEPGIYYQAAYIKLLSKFATATDRPLEIP